MSSWCAELFVSSIIVLLLAVAHEALKVAAKYLHDSVKAHKKASISNNQSWPLTNLNHIVLSVLHTIQVFLGLCLMLVFMTGNIFLCLSVAIGAGFGYYLFGWLAYTRPGIG